jgi:hypothetical protein
MKVFDISAQRLAYRHTLELAGARCELTTNDHALGLTLQRWTVADSSRGHCRFGMQILVSGKADGFTLDGHFRGLHHVVVASFGPDNTFVFDLLRCNVAAIVSERVARDRAFWNEVLLPIAVGVLGAALGILPMHCACLASEGEGLLVAGLSGAGKSTLAAALAQAGFDYISDDWTYLCQQPKGLIAHGMAARLKLLPDCISHFPSLSQYAVSKSLNGEPAYQVTSEVFGARTARNCEPRWGVFLERMPEAGCDFTPISPKQARTYLESSVERLPPQLDDIERKRAQIMDSIATLPWWKLRYGGTPQSAALELRSFVNQKQEAAV